TLYASLNQLDEDNGWIANGGLVIQVDCETLEVTDSWSAEPNPMIEVHPSQPDSLLVRTGVYYEADGEVFTLNPTTGQTSEAHLSEADVGLDVSVVGSVSSGRAIALASSIDDWGATYSILCGDLATGEWIEAETTSSFLIDLEVNDEGEAWIVARTSWVDSDTPGGILVYDVESCTSLTSDDWLNFSLDPYSVAFY
ncbi:MAG: hypothetical protein QGG40_09375, partial [Myxococcota bacterium]|nr:hypothetical protein [Myxococcota bacterium]